MIQIVPETGSTNADLIARIRGGEYWPEGQWLVADRQSAGRGRLGREWFDGKGNFMGSTAVHRRAADPPAGTLSLLAGVAVHEAVAWHAPPSAALHLKWPNDLMAQEGKLAGILLEAAGDAIVVGIGVNLADAPEIPERPATALATLGSKVDRDVFAADLVKAFDTELDRWRNAGLAPLVRRWLDVAHAVGTPLSVSEPGGTFLAGTFDGIDDAGTLRLRMPDGNVRSIQAGDVKLAQKKV